MSVETLEGIRKAIEAHVLDVHNDDVHSRVVTHWFVGYETMQHYPDADDGLAYTVGYTSSPTSPSAVTGCAELALANMKTDLSNGHWGPNDEEEDSND